MVLKKVWRRNVIINYGYINIYAEQMLTATTKHWMGLFCLSYVSIPTFLTAAKAADSWNLGFKFDCFVMFWFLCYFPMFRQWVAKPIKQLCYLLSWWENTELYIWMQSAKSVWFKFAYVPVNQKKANSIGIHFTYIWVLINLSRTNSMRMNMVYANCRTHSSRWCSYRIRQNFLKMKRLWVSLMHSCRIVILFKRNTWNTIRVFIYIQFFAIRMIFSCVLNVLT